jgi:segregation and condensation protein A
MTLSTQEASELAQQLNGPVSREAAEEVLHYLLWQKSQVDEDLKATDTVDHYLELVRDLKEGVHVVIADPYQRATALLFELVLSEEFNPWSIDLVRFTAAFVDRVRSTGALDFAVAGRLIHMAWRILLLQSQEVLAHRESELAPPEVGESDGPAEPLDEGYLGELTVPEAVDATETFLRAPEVPLEGMVRHVENRPVGLMDLALAFQQAEQQARANQIFQAERERLRAWQRTVPEVLAHGDVPESDLAYVWTLAQKHARDEAFPFSELFEPGIGRERVVSLFLATLFLVKERSLLLQQEALYQGTFSLVRLVDERHPVMDEEAPAVPPPAPAQG